MDWPDAPTVAAASPVRTAARRARLARRVLHGAHGGHQVQGRANGAFGIVLVSDRHAPDGHDRVTDELLDRPAVAGDDLVARVEVAGQELARLLRVAVLCEGRGAHQVREQDRYQPPLGGGRGCIPPRPGPRRAPSRAGWSRIRRRTSRRARSDVPQVGQPDASRVPHSAQNFVPGSAAVPQLGHFTRAAPRQRLWLLAALRRPLAARRAAPVCP